MITFRFYLVTLVAVFLAVALGVVIGSTFTEPALVENLQGRIDDVQNNLDDRVAVIDDLNSEIDRLTEYLDESAPWASDSQLVGTEMIVVADEGVDSDAVDALLSRARGAGASTEGVIWVQPSFALREDADLDALNEAIGPVGSDPTSAMATAWEQVMAPAVGGQAPGADPGPTTTIAVAGQPTTTVVNQADEQALLLDGVTLSALEDAGFVEVDRLDDEPGGTAGEVNDDLPVVVVIVTGQESEIPDTGEAAVLRARSQAAFGIPTVLAEVFAEVGDDSEPSMRGETLAPVIDDSDLASLGLVSTVDDLDLVQGRVAVVLAASDLGRSLAGNYGYGDAAQRVLPEWLEQAP